MITGFQAKKQIIRRWIQANFSDQKLAEVYAFNHDGHMRFRDSCNCILGVTLSDTLHASHLQCSSPYHYNIARKLVGAVAVEKAYRVLGSWPHPVPEVVAVAEEDAMDAVRKRRLSAILRAEIRRRDRLRSASAAASRFLELVG